MRKFWTKLATLALVLVVMTSFSACALFSTNFDKKYSQYMMVATAENDSLSVSRQELYYAYLQWYAQYGSQTSYSIEEILTYLTESLMNNKILEQKSIERFGELYDAEEALALKQAYETLNDGIRDEIYEMLSLDANDEETDDSSDGNDVDQPYSPSIIVSYENGERVFTMDLSSYEDDDGEGLLASSDYKYYVPQIPGNASTKVAKQAISKVIRNLQAVEKGFTQLKTPERDYLQPNNDCFTYLTQDERAVLNREIDRMVRANRTSILVSRYSTEYNLGFMSLNDADAKVAWQDYLRRGLDFETWSNKINGFLPVGADKNSMPKYFGCGRAVATNIADEVINYYIEKGTVAIQNQRDFPTSDLESSLISSGLADVYYIPSEVANNLYTVSHILIGFTEEQKTEYNNIKSEAEKNPSDDSQARLNEIYGKTSSNGVSAYDILIEVQTALDKADTVAEKYQIFREFINKYNTDPGMQNLDQLSSQTGKQQYEYLMSADAEKSQMVEQFTKASIELFDNGVKGAISGLVWTEYGAHIIMYTRDIADFIYTGVAGQEDSSIELLKTNYADTLFATLTSYGNRTIFHTLLDSFFTTRDSDYSNHRTGILNEYKKEHTITIYDGEFASFLD